jgi:glycosyltransferase involved in cell wall biosynthesis
MRIAFIVIGNSRRSNYINGHNLRYGKGGGSGTDGSSVLVAEYLVKQGHDVVFVQDKLEPQLEEKYRLEGNVFIPGNQVNGVKYTYDNFEGIDNLEFDILVSTLWFQDYEKLPIRVTKSLIYWCHMQWIYGIGEIMNYVKKHNLSLGFVHISNWEKGMNEGTVNFIKNQYKKVYSCLIPNPIMDDVIEEIASNRIERKKHKFIFHAAWARGGNVAMDAVRQLPYKDKEFHSFDYLMATHYHNDSFFKLHNGVDKKTLFSHIAESEYFIYPLYTPYQDVHKDTFSCVVAEAIALGCVPVTYQLGALPENFDGYCAWLDFPPNVDLKKIQTEPLTKDLNGTFTITSNIIDKILFLEKNTELKEKIKNTGKDFILNKFNSNKIGAMWVDFITDIIK